MTDMKRITIAFPDDLDAAIIALRKTKRFERCSYSEIVRCLIQKGLAAPAKDEPAS